MLTGSTFNASQLLACLEELATVELLGLTLLRQCQSTSWFPDGVPMTQIVQATVEMVNYGNRASAAADRLAHLRPVPLSAPVMEFPL